jgi:hypothetical protein
LQLLSAHGTQLVLLVLRGSFTAPGTVTFDPVPSVPGGPPDMKSSVRAVSVHLSPSGKVARPFITTPATCPASHRWRSALIYTTADGHTYTAHSWTPCRRPAPVQQPAKFRGACELSGTVSFLPPLTITQRPGAVSAKAAGTCSGSVTDGDGVAHALNASPASLAAQSRGSESCGFGNGSGTANLRIARHAVGYEYSEVRTGPGLVLTAAGPGGSAIAEGNVSPSENPLTILNTCATGGLTTAPIDIRLVGY